MHAYGRQPASADLRFAWLGHSGVLLELGGRRLLIDPVFSERASMLPWAGPKRFQPSPIQAVDLPPLDAVLISHDHYDHLDRPTIQALADKTAGFHVPLGVATILGSWGISKARVHEYGWWDAQIADGITITALPARHFSGRGLFNRDRTLWCGWSLSNDRHRIYHSGDTGMTTGFRQIGTECGPFDLAFIKIAAYNESWPDIHLNPEQAVAALQDIRGQALIPIHWAVFDLSLHSWYEPIERLVQSADQTHARIITPVMGEMVEPDNHENKYWWRPFIPGGPDQS
jgi:L-ascorbate metabolism protein UlaG (beta-lactamase superfamily)